MRANKVLYVLFALAIVLATPVHAATITVNSLADIAANNGECTLREAITAANTNTASGAMAGECAMGVGSDTIEFSMAGTIQPLLGGLPNITSVVHINGYSAPGAVKNFQSMSQGTNAVLKIEIDGLNAGNVPGLKLLGSAASGSIIEGLVINNSDNDEECCSQMGIYLEAVNGAAATTLRGNFLGTNIAGTAARPKGSRNVFLVDTANVIIGSDTSGLVVPGSVNLVSGTDADGIVASGANTNIRIRGNLIGTNAAGTGPIPNTANGILFEGASSSWIMDNVVSGNFSVGISVTTGTQNSNNIRIEGNIVGRNAAGTGAMPNQGGIYVAENPNFPDPVSILDIDIVNNLVANNNCAFNCGGITIGENKATDTVKGIRLSGNRVFANQNLEIDLGETNVNNNGLVYGLTPNDPDDADDGGNTLQNFPVVTAALSGGVDVFIEFTLNSEPSKTFTLEFFHTTTCDVGGYGGGEIFLGGDNFATDASGDLEDEITLPLATTTGFITATATNEDNGTSEFSACMAVSEDADFEDGFEDLPP